MSLLWMFRDRVGINSGPDLFSDESFHSNEEQDLTPIELHGLFVDEFDDDYTGEILKKTHDVLVRRMLCLNLEDKMVETEREKSLDHPLGRDILKFLDLISVKLDQDSVPNLFRSNELNPMSNLLTSLLSCHRLRSTFDFEQATKREPKVDKSWDLRWSISLLNEVGGRNTTSDAVFELKKVGNFRGLKREQHIQLPGTPVYKSPRLEDMCQSFERVVITDNGSSPKLKLRLGMDDKLGGMLTYGKEKCEPSPAVQTRRKNVKLQKKTRGVTNHFN